MTWKDAKISVVIPAYNAEKFIGETLESVAKQTWPHVEAFVCDDGSSDNTVAVAKTFESARIKVFTQQNAGACVARNKGLAASSGQYIQFLDADDVLSTDKLSAQMDALKGSSDYLAVSPTVHFMDGDDYMSMKPREESFWIYNNDDPVDFLVKLYGGYGERWMVQTSAWLTPKSICDQIGPWNESLLLDQDGEYFARAVLASRGIRTSGGMNYYRRFYTGANISAKANKKENLESALLALELKSGYIAQHTQSDQFKQALSTLYLEIAINAFPRFNDIVQKCEQRIRETGKKPVLPVMGGQIIESTKNLFGWKTAKRLRQFIHQLKQ